LRAADPSNYEHDAQPRVRADGRKRASLACGALLATLVGRPSTQTLGIMKQSPLLEFESSAFPVAPAEDDETNPGIYGKALAHWLAAQLRAAGFPTGDVIAEDFGWCVPVQSKPHSLYVACASGEASDQWRVFAFAEGGVVARLLGRDTRADSLASLFAAVRGCLQSDPRVRGLREEAA
jgi:hypothetical protein